MTLAIEPMVTLGDRETVLLDDGWTVITADGSRAAHFEHTVAITADGPWVLTAEEALPRTPASRPLPLTFGVGAVNPLPAAMRIADDCGHDHDPTSRYVHRGRQSVG